MLAATLLCMLLLNGFVVVDGFTAMRRRGQSSVIPTNKPLTSSSSSLFSLEKNDDLQGDPSHARKTRITKESKTSKRFATGEELKNLRLDLESLRHNLQWAEALKDQVRIESLQKAIKNGENRDPDLMYKKALRLIAQVKTMKDASSDEKDVLFEKWAKVATAAKECLPQFNLGGLWVGK